MIILRKFSPVSNKSIFCGYLVEARHQGTFSKYSQYILIEK